ncbi:NUDIX domain-containing protein [Butyrivibrio sp. VCD2006]|uniref:NUDIX domain-containing protein n=1 Tax=Butyrivibrio sp. VCD2006 TaxID=1280664 RepID=UPI0003F7D829|nr:NUDIX domain-containing protein [Butyrivibrio sp. VCD2006]
MKEVEIVGDNYFGSWVKSRIACRGIIVQDGKILLTYEPDNGQYMIPGGGLEEGENEEECCIREMAEETGKVVEVSDCKLDIMEYYEDWMGHSKYFLCKIVGETKTNYTEQELAVKMETRWVSVDEAIEEFSKHESYRATDEMRRGMYLREYTALKELLGI